MAVHSVPAYLRGETTILPLRWVVTGTTGDIFPAIDANLELDRTSDGRARLTFRGSYRPPWGQQGFVLDQQRLEEAVAATASGLLHRVAEALFAERIHYRAGPTKQIDAAKLRAPRTMGRLLADPPRASTGPATS